ncbi:putative reductase [Novosphingobium sp. Rr 2-17]|uniref:NAD-dependent epimerase/dehydratase family protein n=1 Tax=Novosphingobium sp. Rr 2-17 TaxID=555793 RepID=UPI000269A851|nr:NAD-dependent epimerase/dehydratase family protein [Novosphingobium sp. Rr 2-17]EIZ78429.1 putative reductase [Novosphingobium sp. Rr 2-17]
MPRHAFILGGTGQIGRAVASNLLAAGWIVSIASRGLRSPPAELTALGAKFVALDRESPGELARVLGDGADALIDVTAYSPAEGQQLLDVQRSVGALVVVSSSSVYRDDEGRALDEAAQNGFPELPDPIAETQPTVVPGDATYSTRKVALENLLLDKATVPVTILRPAAIHGPGSIHPREWWFVKRILDGRQAIPVAYEGKSRFHTSSVLNIAELVRVALDRPSTRILNIADPAALSVAELGSAIARHMSYAGKFVPLASDTFPAKIGRTPWSVPRPFVLDDSAAVELGYRPVTTYAEAVGSICDDLTNAKAGEDWQSQFPILASYPYDLFDYSAEDAFLGERADGSR